VRHGGLEASGRGCQGFGVGGEGAAPYPFGPHGGAGEELRPEGQVDGHVLAVVRLDEGVASPAGEAVDHGHDLEAVPAEVLRRKRRPPPVVPERGHRHARPAPRPGGRWRTSQDSASCPSQKMSASTMTGSPIEAFAG